MNLDFGKVLVLNLLLGSSVFAYRNTVVTTVPYSAIGLAVGQESNVGLYDFAGYSNTQCSYTASRMRFTPVWPTGTNPDNDINFEPRVRYTANGINNLKFGTNGGVLNYPSGTAQYFATVQNPNQSDYVLNASSRLQFSFLASTGGTNPPSIQYPQVWISMVCERPQVQAVPAKPTVGFPVINHANRSYYVTSTANKLRTDGVAIDPLEYRYFVIRRYSAQYTVTNNITTVTKTLVNTSNAAANRKTYVDRNTETNVAQGSYIISTFWVDNSGKESAPVEMRMPINEIKAPTNLVVTPLSGRRLRVTWTPPTTYENGGAINNSTWAGYYLSVYNPAGAANPSNPGAQEAFAAVIPGGSTVEFTTSALKANIPYVDVQLHSRRTDGSIGKPVYTGTIAVIP